MILTHLVREFLNLCILIFAPSNQYPMRATLANTWRGRCKATCGWGFESSSGAHRARQIEVLAGLRFILAIASFGTTLPRGRTPSNESSAISR